LNVSAEERSNIYSTVAAVLHLGNVGFEDDPDDSHGGSRVSPSSEAALTTAAGLMAVDTAELRQALLFRTMQTGGSRGDQRADDDVIMVPLKTREAASARDALAKAMYSKLFDYIVEKINESIPFQSSANYIGVLDIAGFGQCLFLNRHK
jgi:myosin-6